VSCHGSHHGGMTGFSGRRIAVSSTDRRAVKLLIAKCIV
jgi:hypothetical protein